MGWTLCEFMEYKANHGDFFFAISTCILLGTNWVLTGYITINILQLVLFDNSFDTLSHQIWRTWWFKWAPHFETAQTKPCTEIIFSWWFQMIRVFLSQLWFLWMILDRDEIGVLHHCGVHPPSQVPFMVPRNSTRNEDPKWGRCFLFWCFRAPGFYPNQGGQYRELAGLGRGAVEDSRVVVHRGFNMFLTMKIGRYKWIQHYTTGKCWLRIPLGIRH